jgi:hypothetical protein
VALNPTRLCPSCGNCYLASCIFLTCFNTWVTPPLNRLIISHIWRFPFSILSSRPGTFHWVTTSFFWVEVSQHWVFISFLTVWNYSCNVFMSVLVLVQYMEISEHGCLFPLDGCELQLYSIHTQYMLHYDTCSSYILQQYVHTDSKI